MTSARDNWKVCIQYIEHCCLVLAFAITFFVVKSNINVRVRNSNQILPNNCILTNTANMRFEVKRKKVHISNPPINIKKSILISLVFMSNTMNIS